jgi:UDP-GlcNAc:undecaprenyl-phosphate GlcNAc-1-phosphate transferase
MTSLGLIEYAAVLVGSAVLTLLLVPFALRAAIRRGVFGQLGSGQLDGSVPYVGGAAVVVAFSCVILLGAWAARPVERMDELLALIVTAVLLALVGVVDDLRRLPIPVRLSAMVLAAGAVWAAGIRIELFDHMLLSLAVTVVWIVGITSSFNLLDNIDGLSAGVAGIAAFSFWIIAAANDQYLVGALSAALIGCALAFLRHNYFPARIYMGDAGSNFFGFMLAALAIKLKFDAPDQVRYMVPLLVLAVPIFDMALVVMTRVGAARSVFQAARDHTSHRLVAAGLPVPAAVGLIYSAAFAVGWLGLVVSRLSDTTTACLVVVLVAAIALIAGVFLASTLPMAQPIVGLTPVGAVLKRVFDVVVGLPLAIFVTPVIIVLAIISATTLKAWPFFVQERVGRGGRNFRFWKIRTLPRNAPRYALKPEIGEIKLSRFSTFLRTRHLDELPQLYAVLLGRMSLVGPRPKMPDEFEPVAEEYAELRTRVPQGCTCLWQVGVHTAGLPSDSPEYDYWYLRHWSMRLDLWILWRTMLTLIGAGRDMALEDIPVWLVGRRYQTGPSAAGSSTQHELDRRALH